MVTTQPVAIEMTVRSLIADYTHRPITDITGDRALDDLGLDSLGTIELILACEDTLGIVAITDEDMDIRTVGQAVAFVRRCIGDPGPEPGAVRDNTTWDVPQ